MFCQCTTCQIFTSEYVYNPWGQEGPHCAAIDGHDSSRTTYEPPRKSMLCERQQHPAPFQPFTQPTDDDPYATGFPAFTEAYIHYVAGVCVWGPALAHELSTLSHPRRAVQPYLDTSRAAYDASPPLPPSKVDDMHGNVGWYSPPQTQYVGVADATTSGYLPPTKPGSSTSSTTGSSPNQSWPDSIPRQLPYSLYIQQPHIALTQPSPSSTTPPMAGNCKHGTDRTEEWTDTIVRTHISASTHHPPSPQRLTNETDHPDTK